MTEHAIRLTLGAALILGLATSTPVAAGQPAWTIAPEALANARNRPAFSPDRRPLPTPAAANPFGMTTLDAVLIGTVVGPEPIAVVKSASSEETARLRLGQSWRGWEFIAADPGAATFRRADETMTLHLSTAKKAGKF